MSHKFQQELVGHLELCPYIIQCIYHIPTIVIHQQRSQELAWIHALIHLLIHLRIKLLVALVRHYGMG